MDNQENLSLHEACYQGRLDIVRMLLATGIDPNCRASENERQWISAAGNQPKPLNCVAIAWGMMMDHISIAQLLIEHGAVVDETVIRDHEIESAGGNLDNLLRDVFKLGLEMPKV